MKTKISVLIVIFVISLPAFAQDFTFEYDDAGNRTDRYISLPPPSKSATIDTTLASNEQAAEQDKLHEKLGNFDLSVYPNPTKGEVVVEISSGSLSRSEGGKSISTATYKVFDLSGREILAGQATSSPIKVNLSGQVAGTYFLRVNINGETCPAGGWEKSWKVVKE